MCKNVTDILCQLMTVTIFVMLYILYKYYRIYNNQSILEGLIRAMQLTEHNQLM